MDVTEFSPLLEDVETEVKEIMIKEKRSISKGSELGDMEMMGPRIAQLKDELEKRDKIITKLKKDNIALKVAKYLYGCKQVLIIVCMVGRCKGSLWQ